MLWYIIGISNGFDAKEGSLSEIFYLSCKPRDVLMRGANTSK